MKILKILTVLLMTSPAFALSGKQFIGDDFTSYADDTALKAKMDATGKNFYYVYWYKNQLSLDSNVLYKGHPTLKYFQPESVANTPQAQVYFTPKDSIWVKMMVRYEPGWTTVGNGFTWNGSTYAPSAASYKVLFFGWNNYYGRGEMEYAGGSGQIIGMGMQTQSGTKVMLPKYSPYFSALKQWSDGLWHQYIFLMERVSLTEMRLRHWQAPDGQTPVLKGDIRGTTINGLSVESVRFITLGANYNQVRKAGQNQFWNLGEWEIVDAAVEPDPYGILNSIPIPPPPVVPPPVVIPPPPVVVPPPPVVPPAPVIPVPDARLKDFTDYLQSLEDRIKVLEAKP